MNERGETMEATTEIRPIDPERVRAPADSDQAVLVPDAGGDEVVFDLEDVAVSYGGVPAVEHVTIGIFRNRITALIGPSGCGKTTVLRCLNRMNDLIEGASVRGSVRY